MKKQIEEVQFKALQDITKAIEDIFKGTGDLILIKPTRTDKIAYWFLNISSTIVFYALLIPCAIIAGFELGYEKINEYVKTIYRWLD